MLPHANGIIWVDPWNCVCISPGVRIDGFLPIWWYSVIRLAVTSKKVLVAETPQPLLCRREAHQWIEEHVEESSRGSGSHVLSPAKPVVWTNSSMECRTAGLLLSGRYNTVLRHIEEHILPRAHSPGSQASSRHLRQPRRSSQACGRSIPPTLEGLAATHGDPAQLVLQLLTRIQRRKKDSGILVDH